MKIICILMCVMTVMHTSLVDSKSLDLQTCKVHRPFTQVLIEMLQNEIGKVEIPKRNKVDRFSKSYANKSLKKLDDGTKRVLRFYKLMAAIEKVSKSSKGKISRFLQISNTTLDIVVSGTPLITCNITKKCKSTVPEPVRYLKKSLCLPKKRGIKKRVKKYLKIKRKDLKILRNKRMCKIFLINLREILDEFQSQEVQTKMNGSKH